MKKLIMAMLIAVSMVPTISAQDNNRQRMTPQQRTEQRIQKLDEKLSLTDNQKSQIRDLYADFYKQKYPKENDFRPAGALQAIAGGGSSRKTETRA